MPESAVSGQVNRDRAMTAEATVSDRGPHGYFAPGNSIARRGRESKLARIHAKIEELSHSTAVCLRYLLLMPAG